MNHAPLSPMSALFAHVEPMIAGRRILMIGNASNAAAIHLLERGARLIQVLDPDPRRVAAAAAQNTERKITFSQLTPHSLRDGSFELALIEDVELAENYGQLIEGIRRSLGATGTAIFCARNSEASSGLLGTSRGGLSYDSFSDALWEQFDQVSMWGQSPFLGYSIVQFGLEHAPEPVLDNGYVGTEGEPPDYYIAICESVGATTATAEMSIVQLPASRVLLDSETGHREKERRAAKRVEALEQEVAQLRRQASSSEVDRLVTLLEEKDTWIRTLESKAASATSRADDAEAEVDELEQELEKAHSAISTHAEAVQRAQAESDRPKKELAAAQTRAQKLEQELKAARSHAEEITHLSAGSKALEEELNNLAQENVDLKKTISHQAQSVDKLQKRVAVLDIEVDELHKQLDETDGFLHDAEEELKETQAKWQAALQLPSSEKEVTDLEDQLTERGKRVLELESQLRKLENYCHTLKLELKAPGWIKEDGIQAEFEQLARTLAEREADLVAAEWTIGQLKSAGKN